MNLLHATATHVGLVRSHNEDAHLVVPGRLYCVADGLGGHAAGEVASSLAVFVLSETVRTIPTQTLDRKMQDLMFESAHRTIIGNAAAHPERTGMGTTLTSVVVVGDKAYVAHVGDSRCHLVRDGVGQQVTTDHTVAEEARARGVVVTSESLEHTLSNCLGVSEGSYKGADVTEIHLRPGDVFVLCTDGLTASAEEVACVAGLKPEPQDLVDALVGYALGEGGFDNVTVVVVKVI